jgi:uncharacterized protein
VKRTVFSAAALFLFAIVTAWSQERPTVTAQPNTLFLGADGKFESAPDTAIIQFNISTQEQDSRTAYDRAGKAAEQVREVLRSNGIDPKSAEIGYFSLDPVYDYRSPKRKLVGFRVSSSVTLKLKNFSKIGPITQQLSDIDVTANQSVNYTLEDIDAAKIKAVEDAFQRARAEALALAQSAGRSLGELSYASVDTFEVVRQVMPMMRMATPGVAGAQVAAPTEEFTPQKVTTTAHVNALFNLK